MLISSRVIFFQEGDESHGYLRGFHACVLAGIQNEGNVEVGGGDHIFVVGESWSSKVTDADAAQAVDWARFLLDHRPDVNAKDRQGPLLSWHRGQTLDPAIDGAPLKVSAHWHRLALPSEEGHTWRNTKRSWSNNCFEMFWEWYVLFSWAMFPKSQHVEFEHGSNIFKPSSH